MDKVKIKKTLKCDTRTLPKGAVISQEDAKDDTLKHRQAVIDTCDFVAKKLKEQVKEHDWSKLGSNLKQFTDGLNKGIESKEFDDWYQMHVALERHHLKKFVPEDVNIVDLIEMICDCVCAGKARTGDVYPLELPNDLLQKVIANTVEWLKKNIEVED